MKERYKAIGSYDGKIYFQEIIEAENYFEAQMIAHEKTVQIVYRENNFELKSKKPVIIRVESANC